MTTDSAASKSFAEQPDLLASVEAITPQETSVSLASPLASSALASAPAPNVAQDAPAPKTVPHEGADVQWPTSQTVAATPEVPSTLPHQSISPPSPLPNQESDQAVTVPSTIAVVDGAAVARGTAVQWQETEPEAAPAPELSSGTSGHGAIPEHGVASPAQTDPVSQSEPDLGEPSQSEVSQDEPSQGETVQWEVPQPGVITPTTFAESPLHLAVSTLPQQPQESQENGGALEVSSLEPNLEAIASPAPAIAQAVPLPTGTSVATGSPIQWNAAQGTPAAAQAIPPTPGSAAGNWVMVWIPYGAPMMPSPGNVGPGAVPNGNQTAYFPAWAPAGIPGQIAPSTVNPYGTGGTSGVVPWGGNSVANSGYGYPYGASNPSFGSVPTSYPAQPYAAQANYGAQPYVAQPYGTQPYGAQPYGTQSYGVPQSYGMPQAYGAQPYGTQPYGTQPYGAQPYGTQPYGAPPYANAYQTPQSPQGFYIPPAPTLNPSGSGLLTVPASPNNSNGIPALPSPPPTAVPTFPPNSYPGIVPTNVPNIPVVPLTSAPTNSSAIAQAPTTAAALTAAQPRGPITDPSLTLQGLYVLQDGQSSARARLNGAAFLTPSVLVGGTLDVVSGPDLTSADGVQLTELYVATSLPGVPGLRFRLGQLDLTSYFDRNSFAKDISRDFFNSTFQTNPALIGGANATASRPAGLVQWAINDDLAISAAAFSSSSNITDFALDGFAGEVDFRTGNLIVRGTFLTSRDTQFQGTGDRLDSYGLNAEYFLPSANIGFFGRYGHLNNSNTGFSSDTFSLGLNALDVFMDKDRLGLAYGRNLETDLQDGRNPDVLEVFYDFEVMPNIRAGFTFQQRNSFTESFAGFRIRGDLDLAPSLSLD